MKKVRCELCACVQPARTYHCDLCGVCVHKRDHHSIWLDTCIGSKNQKYFMGALVALLFCCFYSSNLTLTTICHPTLMGGLLLVPDDCSDVFGDIHIAICFVSSVYTLMIAALGIFLLFQQLWLVSHNTTYKSGNKDKWAFTAKVVSGILWNSSVVPHEQWYLLKESQFVYICKLLFFSSVVYL
ncbi:palmitoyltransferase [Caerostris extrusa]|uniref:Palmitoyltransferase n=1 Tax=Caerostris extrusa TaxID=172846 RepID=A0AAV4XXR8_CAEEX|nr:palmitoyltransferase [Caerostris extrusa]